MRFEDVKEAAAGPREVERRMVLRVLVESMIDIIIYLIKGDYYLFFRCFFCKNYERL